MKFKLNKCLLAVAAATAISVPAMQAQAGGTINFGDDKSITIGLGMRTSFTSEEDSAPNGTSRSKDFNLDSIRLYTSASLNKYIKGTFNTEKNADDTVKMIDAIAQFEFMPEFNLWAGQMLPPSDRANLDGPYYLSAWSYPGVVSQYQNKNTGRDVGVTAWGKLLDKHLVYSVGTYEGNHASSFAGSDTDPNRSDALMYAGRLQYDFWSAGLDPAYYTSSTYYGKDVLSVALVGMYQKDAVGNNSVKDDYLAYNVDAVLEKVFTAGVLNLEGAAYKYDFSNAAVIAGTSTTNGVSSSPVKAGKAYLGQAAWMFPDVVGWGKFQPYVRYQKFIGDGSASLDVKEYDLGLNYIIDAHNARLSAVYTNNKTETFDTVNKFTVGLQLQF
jgi:hypothetical protein